MAARYSFGADRMSTRFRGGGDVVLPRSRLRDDVEILDERPNRVGVTARVVGVAAKTLRAEAAAPRRKPLGQARRQLAPLLQRPDRRPQRRFDRVCLLDVEALGAVRVADTAHEAGVAALRLDPKPPVAVGAAEPGRLSRSVLACVAVSGRRKGNPLAGETHDQRRDVGGREYV